MEQAVLPNGDMNAIFGFTQKDLKHGFPSGTSIGHSSAMSVSEGSIQDEDERAPLSMRPKRVGRKLDTKEPESKRRAQNRAAQRAFRERKERHLQELETRIQELEQESATWRNSSIMLRGQVSALEQELSDFRPSTGAPSPALNVSEARGQQSVPSLMLQREKQPSPPLYNKKSDMFSPNSRGIPDDKLLYDAYGTPKSTSPATPAQSAMGENPTPSEFCDELNLACVIPPERETGFKGVPHTIQVPPPPYQHSAPSDFGMQTPATLLSRSEAPTSINGSVSGRTNREGSSSSSGSGSVPGPAHELPELSQAPMSLGDQLGPQQLIPNINDFDMQKPGAQGNSVMNFSFQDDQAFDVFSFVNNESTLFDGFDLDAVWNTDAPALQEMPMISPQAQTEKAHPQTLSTGSRISVNQTQAKVESPEQDTPVIVPATKEKYISCTEVWDRICSRPKFGEIDIQGMCMELRAKAKCSDSGVVLPEKDVDLLLNTYK